MTYYIFPQICEYHSYYVHVCPTTAVSVYFQTLQIIPVILKSLCTAILERRIVYSFNAKSGVLLLSCPKRIRALDESKRGKAKLQSFFFFQKQRKRTSASSSFFSSNSTFPSFFSSVVYILYTYKYKAGLVNPVGHTWTVRRNLYAFTS